MFIILYHDSIIRRDDMQNLHTTQTLKNDFKEFLIRLGKIFSNISILALLLCISGILSFVATAFILLIGLVVIILSVGTIFAIVPNYFDILMSTSEVSVKISAFFLENFYIFASIAIVGAVLSLILLLLDKRNKHIARIVISSVVIAIVILVIIVVATGVI